MSRQHMTGQHHRESPAASGAGPSAKSRGFAMIAAVLLVLLVGGLGTALILDATTETRTNANFRESVQAFYVAKSGLEEGRARIPTLSTNPLTLPVTANDVIYVINGAAVNPTSSTNSYYDSQWAAEFPGITPNVISPMANSIQPSGAGLPYQWVRVTIKTEASTGQDVDRDGALNNTTPVYWDGTSQNLVGSGKPVYKLTALATLPNGSRSLLQLEGSQPPPFSTDAAIASQDDVRLQGSFTVSGDDFCGQSSTVFAVKTTQDVDTAGNSGATTGLTGPSPNTTGTYEDAPPTYDINILINTLKPYATPIQQVDSTVTYSASSQTYSGSNVNLGVPPPQPPPPGETGTPVITYVQGNLGLSSNNSKGAGILIVDGDLNVSGGFYYYGLIVVKGIVSFTGGGSNSTNIYGSIVSGSSFTNSTNVGGGVNVQYDSCAIQNPYKAIPLKVLAFREIVNF